MYPGITYAIVTRSFTIVRTRVMHTLKQIDPYLSCDWWLTTRLKLFNTRLNITCLQPADDDDDERSYHRCGCTIWSGVMSSTEQAAAAKSTLQR